MARYTIGLLPAILCAGLGTAAAQDCPVSHTVVRGDTLSLIARRYYGDPLKYRQIYDANRAAIGRNPSIIELGIVLTIPCKDGRTPAVSAASGSGDVATVEPSSESSVPEPAATATPFVGIAPPAGWMPLIDVAALSREVPGEIQVLDIRAEGSAATGFIPGALPVPFALWRGDPTVNDGIPDDRVLSRLIGGSGLDLNAPIVVVAAGRNEASIGQAAWVYWLLKSAGARQIAILEAGFEGWEASGAQIATAPGNARTRQIAVTLAEDWTSRTADVAKMDAGDAQGTVLAARPELFLTDAGGAGGAAGSRSAEVLEILKGQPVDWERRTVVFTSPDVLSAAAAWFYASEVAGIRNVRLHPSPRSN